MKEILNKKFVVIGDLHFGMKGFNEDFFKNQINFFSDQLFPFMKENGISTIIQLGDLLDNRKNINIKFFDSLYNDFFKEMERNDIKMVSILGNHDIYYSTTLEVNLIKYFQKLFPDTFSVLESITDIKIGTNVFRFFPWVINKKITKEDLRGADYIFGHFEIKNFEMVKGHFDNSSDLSSSFFKMSSKLKGVMSGHYHIQSSDGFVSYAGTPYQMNWGDYNTPRGFYLYNGTDYKFIENFVSKKFVKIKYDERTEDKIEVSGLGEKMNFSSVLNPLFPDLTDHIVKFFINYSKSKDYEIVSFELNQKGIKFDIVNNVTISNLIGLDFKGEIDNIGGTELIFKTIKEKSPHLLSIYEQILREIEEEV